MQANELRIGNIINYRGKYSNYKGITELTSHLFSYLLEVNDEWDLIEPVPINEIWLLKFGFDGLSKNDKELFELIHNDYIGYRFSIEGQYGYPEVKYVHQLQSLYFALTETELTII